MMSQQFTRIKNSTISKLNFGQLLPTWLMLDHKHRFSSINESTVQLVAIGYLPQNDFMVFVSPNCPHSMKDCPHGMTVGAKV